MKRNLRITSVEEVSFEGLFSSSDFAFEGLDLGRMAFVASHMV